MASLGTCVGSERGCWRGERREKGSGEHLMVGGRWWSSAWTYLMTEGVTAFHKSFLELLSALQDVCVFAYYFSKTSSKIYDCGMEIVLSNEDHRPHCRWSRISLHSGGIPTGWKCCWWMTVRRGGSKGGGGYAKVSSMGNKCWRLRHRGFYSVQPSWISVPCMTFLATVRALCSSGLTFFVLANANCGLMPAAAHSAAGSRVALSFMVPKALALEAL